MEFGLFVTLKLVMAVFPISLIPFCIFTYQTKVFLYLFFFNAWHFIHVQSSVKPEFLVDARLQPWFLFYFDQTLPPEPA